MTNAYPFYPYNVPNATGHDQVNMEQPNEPETRYNRQLPTLLSALHLLYVGRAIAGFVTDAQSPRPPVDFDVVDATIEAFTDEIRTTELLHEAALLVGDVE